MGQEDYLLREIEKIAIMLRFILSKLNGNKENFAITQEKQFEETKELLFNEINFDIGMFLKLNESDSNEYIAKMKGNSTENLEIMAEIMLHLGVYGNQGNKSVYLQKALQLYEYCNLADRTFSVGRENKITKIKNMLYYGGHTKM